VALFYKPEGRGFEVVALFYKPEDCGFDSWWGYRDFYRLSFSGRTMTLGSTQPLTYMSTGDIPWGVKAGGA
jgi:hypothetical protein